MTRSEVITNIYALFNAPHNADINIVGLNKVLDDLVSAEREACAKVCEDSVPTYLKDGERWLKGQNGKPDVRLKEIAPNLESAWEAEQLLKNGSVIESYSVQHKCAAAIRARGQA